MATYVRPEPRPRSIDRLYADLIAADGSAKLSYWGNSVLAIDVPNITPAQLAAVIATAKVRDKELDIP